MKKVIIGLIVFVAVIVAAVAILFNSINKEKTVVLANEFVRYVEGKGYYTKNITSQYTQYGESFKNVYLAGNSEFRIEYYEMLSDEHAISMYNTNKANFEEQKTSGYTSSNVAINNYAKYTLKVNGKYKYLSRVGNTFIYVDVDEKYEDKVKEIIDGIGY